MSEEVHYKGILKEVVKFEGETLENQCKRILGALQLKKHYDSYQEMFENEFYKEYVIYENKIYQVENKQDVDAYEDIFIASKNQDGTINFEVKYYNGGCSFDEAIENALDNMI